MTNLLRKTKIEGTVGKKEKIPKAMEERKKKNGKMKKKVKGKKDFYFLALSFRPC